jgi:hypothetical protein
VVEADVEVEVDVVRVISAEARVKVLSSEKKRECKRAPK